MLNVKLGRANELAFPSVAESCFFTLPTSLHLSLNATISVTTSQALYSADTRLKSPGIVCFKAEAATANSRASP